MATFPSYVKATSLTAALALVLAGCGSPQPRVMAPPVQSMAPVQSQNGGTYQWQDVPAGQQVPISRAVFDQGGYQLYAQSGETILVPFVNQNLYVMKFGQTSGGMYFVNQGGVPTLYIQPGMGLENATASGARWYPFSQNYAYTQPVYVGLAPTWGEYMGMGWYPGMSYYGGYWGYNPWHSGLAYAAMSGLVFRLASGQTYGGWGSYHDYYVVHNVGRVGWSSRPSYNYTSVGRRPGAFGSATSNRGSFGRSSGAPSSSFGRSSGSSFGSSSRSGSFGGGSTRSSFGSGSSGFSNSQSRSSGSFGGGSMRAPSSSFGRSSGGSFGRSSGGSFGGGRRR